MITKSKSNCYRDLLIHYSCKKYVPRDTRNRTPSTFSSIFLACSKKNIRDRYKSLIFNIRQSVIVIILSILWKELCHTDTLNVLNATDRLKEPWQRFQSISFIENSPTSHSKEKERRCLKMAIANMPIKPKSSIMISEEGCMVTMLLGE